MISLNLNLLSHLRTLFIWMYWTDFTWWWWWTVIFWTAWLFPHYKSGFLSFSFLLSFCQPNFDQFSHFLRIVDILKFFLSSHSLLCKILGQAIFYLLSTKFGTLCLAVETLQLLSWKYLLQYVFIFIHQIQQFSSSLQLILFLPNELWFP